MVALIDRTNHLPKEYTVVNKDVSRRECFNTLSMCEIKWRWWWLLKNYDLKLTHSLFLALGNRACTWSIKPTAEIYLTVPFNTINQSFRGQAADWMIWRSGDRAEEKSAGEIIKKEGRGFTLGAFLFSVREIWVFYIVHCILRGGLWQTHTHLCTPPVFELPWMCIPTSSIR